jgi:dimethylaniline monooxygenase (N-oxide forming)
LSQAYVFLNKSQKAMTFINRPYFARSRLLSFLSSYSDPEEDVNTPGQVEIMPAPVGVDSNGRMKFDWEATKQRGGSWVKVAKRMEGRKCEPDLVILATGYKQEVKLLPE